jgi:hypothetical protein
MSIQIIAHSLAKYMVAMTGRALAPMFLQPRRYGGINLERAYCAACKFRDEYNSITDLFSSSYQKLSV